MEGRPLYKIADHNSPGNPSTCCHASTQKKKKTFLVLLSQFIQDRRNISSFILLFTSHPMNHFPYSFIIFHAIHPSLFLGKNKHLKIARKLSVMKGRKHCLVSMTLLSINKYPPCESCGCVCLNKMSIKTFYFSFCTTSAHQRESWTVSD